MNSFKSRYMVNTVPWYWWPWWMLWSLIGGLAMYFYILLVRYTSRVEYVGNSEKVLENHVIFCVWHDEIWTGFIAFGFKFWMRQILLNHPHWYMKPIHITLWMLGERKLVLGSSGNRGVEAAKELAVLLRAGASTVVSPDGPYGPYHVIKNGTHFLAKDSGLPIITITLSCKRKILLGGWDHKIMPLPFNSIRVIAHPPVVPASTPEETNTKLEAAWKSL